MKSFLRKSNIRDILPVSVWNFMKLIKFMLVNTACRMKVLLHLPLKKKRSKIQFEIQIVEHCNLNCKSCSNFSPLAEPEFVSIEEFTRDMKRMGEIFGHKCEYIYLLGGEPLLHPEIITLMKIARDNFSEGNIYVFTNGILLPRMSDDFWQACHDSNISILISAYPIELDEEKIKAMKQKYGVSVQWAWNEGKKERSRFIVRPINLAGTSNIKLNFTICGGANRCITLSKGRLYTCSFAPHVWHFNKFFHQNVNITEADSVNIYDDITADEILKRMAEPIPACRYCNLNVKTIEWGISQKNFNEWA